MSAFAIVEVADGFEVVEIPTDQTAEDAAIAVGGELADPGPYDSYQEAVDALDQLEPFDELEMLDEGD